MYQLKIFLIQTLKIPPYRFGCNRSFLIVFKIYTDRVWPGQLSFAGRVPNLNKVLLSSSSAEIIRRNKIKILLCVFYYLD